MAVKSLSSLSFNPHRPLSPFSSSNASSCSSSSASVFFMGGSPFWTHTRRSYVYSLSPLDPVKVSRWHSLPLLPPTIIPLSGFPNLPIARKWRRLIGSWLASSSARPAGGSPTPIITMYISDREAEAPYGPINHVVKCRNCDLRGHIRLVTGSENPLTAEHSEDVVLMIFDSEGLLPYRYKTNGGWKATTAGGNELLLDIRNGRFQVVVDE